MGQASNPSSLGFDNFFSLEVGSPSPRVLWFSPKDFAVPMKLFLEVKRGERGVRTPIELVARHGCARTDFLGNELALPVVNEKVMTQFRKQHVKGWRRFPVTLYAKNGTPIEAGYTGLSVTGRAGPLDRRRSVTASRTRADGTTCIHGMNGLYFDLDKWDGSDLFMLEDPSVAFVLCTRKLVDALRAIKATGWNACPVKNYVFGVQRNG